MALSVLSIPFLVLWNTRIPLQKKLILLGIFSATIFIMVTAIIRVAVGMTYDRQMNIDWLCFWSFVEVDVGRLTPSLLVFYILSLTLNGQQLLSHVSLPSDNSSSRPRIRARLQEPLIRNPC